ncbi:MAG: hypothetical protein HFJ48_02720 [Clostridia bacterium]|nr:hypothetical protein [Clostridia bacterium]
MFNRRNNSVTKEDSYKKLNLISSEIKNIDFKVCFLLALVGTFLAFLFLKGKPDAFNSIPIINFKNITSFPVKELANLNFGQVLPMIVIIILYVLIISCFILLLLALKGKTSYKINKQYKLKIDSLIAFENIANMNYAIYKRKCKSLNNYELINDINSQIYINSIICNFKNKLYFYSIKLLIISFIIFCICQIFSIL